MESNELRLDNLVYSTTHKAIYRIMLLDKDEIINTEPIPLTKHWLDRFGFEEINNGIGWDELTNSVLKLVKVPTNNSEIISYNYATDKYTFIKYVHQLQNLYFALTNTELKLKQ